MEDDVIAVFCHLPGCKTMLSEDAYDAGIRLCKGCMNEQIEIAFANPELAGVDE
jgi:hypothetical protein